MLALLQMAVTGATAQTTNTAIFVAGNTNTIQGEGGKATVTVTENSTTTDVTTDIGTDGRLSSLKAGQTVTMDAKEGYEFRSVTAVKQIFVTAITLNKTETSIVFDKDEALIATVTPSDATDKTVTWSSDKESVATVDAEGKVTAVAVGTANITVTANDGSIYSYTGLNKAITTAGGTALQNGKYYWSSDSGGDQANLVRIDDIAVFSADYTSKTHQVRACLAF